MSKFTLKSIESMSDDLQFNQLVILRNSVIVDEVTVIDSKGVLDLFEASIQKSDLVSYFKILTYMEIIVANKLLLPNNKYKLITPYKDPIIEYEFKHGNLRVYGITMNNMYRIIIHCGFKNKQAEDIIRFRSLKKQFLEQA